MDLTSTVRRPPPIDQFEVMIQTSKLSRDSYVLARDMIQEWMTSLGVKPWPLYMDEGMRMNLTFIDYKLTKDEIVSARDWLSEDDPKTLTMVNELVEEGYRLTCTKDTKNECVVVTIIGKSADNPNRDMAMSTRHGTVRQALLLALFKHYKIFQNGAWGTEAQDSMFG